MRLRESDIGKASDLVIGFLMTKEGIGSKRAQGIFEGLSEAEKGKLCRVISCKKSYRDFVSYLGASGIEVMGKGEGVFERRFGGLKYQPAVLFCRGNKGLMGRNLVAVVGSRNCDQYGVNATRRIVEQVSRCDNVALVTGLALGVDSVALAEAKKCAIPTISVIAGGHKILSNVKDDLILSEYPPANKLSKGHFIIRNRLIASLADVVIVVQAGEKSGALYTAEYAKQCKKLLFAVPGQITDYRFTGCNRLISHGAKIIDWDGEWLRETGLIGFADKQENLFERVIFTLSESISYDKGADDKVISYEEENKKILLENIVKALVSSGCQKDKKCTLIGQEIVENNFNILSKNKNNCENRRLYFFAVNIFCKQYLLSGQGLSIDEMCEEINEFRRDEIYRYLTKLEVGGILRQNLLGKYILC